MHTVCAFVILFGTGADVAVAAVGSLELASDAVAIAKLFGFHSDVCERLQLESYRVGQIRVNALVLC
ncbi:MAG TPA: hypothetical protein VGO73_05655 [Pyrinomonadaceae bacterium]|nr:hypothetical protein [Pyrinomonadaceae bacterium]